MLPFIMYKFDSLRTNAEYIKNVLDAEVIYRKNLRRVEKLEKSRGMSEEAIEKETVVSNEDDKVQNLFQRLYARDVLYGKLQEKYEQKQNV